MHVVVGHLNESMRLLTAANTIKATARGMQSQNI